MAMRPFSIVPSLLVVASSHALSVLRMSTAPKHTLYDMPVSNNGARCRIIAYKKKLSADEFAIAPPKELGGLKSEEYLALNPQGKMPLLTVADGMAIPESDTICRYLMSTYADRSPSFLPDSPKSNLIARIHDMYLTTIQGCMYKAAPPFGIYGTRSDAIAEFRKQLGVIEDLLEEGTDYICGSEVSLADATLFPTIVFSQHMMPKFIPDEPALPPKLDRWFHGIQEKDVVFKKVCDEIHTGLSAWEDRGRWDSIWMAGVTDDEPETIFDKIISGDIPSAKVRETADILAFKDINPVAPAHILVIPKDRMGLSRLRKASSEHIEILGKLLVAAGEIAQDTELGFGDGARIIINDGKDGGQEVPHLHVHVLGGRTLSWPPG